MIRWVSSEIPKSESSPTLRILFSSPASWVLVSVAILRDENQPLCDVVSSGGAHYSQFRCRGCIAARGSAVAGIYRCKHKRSHMVCSVRDHSALAGRGRSGGRADFWLDCVFLTHEQVVGWYLENSSNGTLAYSVNVFAATCGLEEFSYFTLVWGIPR